MGQRILVDVYKNISGRLGEKGLHEVGQCIVSEICWSLGSQSSLPLVMNIQWAVNKFQLFQRIHPSTVFKNSIRDETEPGESSTFDKLKLYF